MLDPSPMSDTPHLLLVDDERSIREPLAVYLTKQGFRVTQAGDAASARTRLAAYAIDLVILDIMMPGEDGLSLCRHIAATSEVPVILLTAIYSGITTPTEAAAIAALYALIVAAVVYRAMKWKTLYQIFVDSARSAD